MKSILVYMTADEGLEARFQASVDIVRCLNGHLTCLQPTASIEAYTPVGPYGAAVFAQEALDRVREIEASERQKLEDRLRAEEVNWDWHAHSGAAAALMASHSWLTELAIVSVPASDWRSRFEMPPIAADVVVHSRAPVLAVPAGLQHFHCRGTALVAWNGSPEACLALRGALPLLALADGVILASASQDSGDELPASEAAKFLARYDIASEVMEIAPGGQPVAGVIRNAAQGRNAAYVVMGGYGHSRIRESLLGGVTREMLIDSPIPLLLAH